ncbi:MAG TPA: ABC transporter substrate-binding protein [Pyrinomonadaceae bacterium]|nr:ABC transporter substrate-binding protein [Pyrinomonadaceae bacterium]
MPRIVSFLPSATEMVCALSGEDDLVGITHECDYPESVRSKPVVVRNVLPIEAMTQGEIDRAVAERLRAGQSLYQIDEDLLASLAPDLILTQNLCQVCAPSGNEVAQVLKALPQQPEILWLTPQSVSEIFQNITDLGHAIGRTSEAQQLVRDCRKRLESVRAKTSSIPRRPRVFCMEWLDPVYACGHWVPEQVGIAGGVDEIGSDGGESVRVSWETMAEAAPEILIIMPCGFNLPQTMKQIWQHLGPYSSLASESRTAFLNLPAVRSNRVYAVDANSYFARPGPRVVDGTELLAHLIHPDRFSWNGPTSAYLKVDLDLLRGDFVEARDFYRDGAALVFTESYLRRRGYCCDSGCRHCPY